MGQTLSHGVYLPNEGERNCYAGLASNWQILNTAVGNIAEKAPLVHTHGNISNDGKVGTTANLPLITGTGGAVQAGSFGNAANTFCEGNDSRLSDARTPVAHTHTKSDVTDLLNSNFIPSANNSYDLGSSSYQWKTLNGINPGALSLPNINYTEGSPDVYNVGTDINSLTKNTTDPLHFSWTSPFDGWLAIMWYLRNLTPPFNILITTHSEDRFSKFSQTWSASSTQWYLGTTFPVVKNVTYYFHIDFQNTTIGVVHHAYLLPCLGNV